MSPVLSRRHFLQGCAAATAVQGIAPGRLLAGVGTRDGRHASVLPSSADDFAARVDPTLVKQLALRAIDAAKAAGVTYADVRLTRSLWSQRNSVPLGSTGGNQMDGEELVVGVRCLVNGYWGFASSPFWTPEEVVALARSAAVTAKANAKGPPRTVEWAPIPVASGDWVMPVEIDPFTVPLEERSDFAAALAAYCENYRMVDGPGTFMFSGGVLVHCYRQERALATTEGAYCTQVVYQTDAGGGISRQLRDRKIDVPFRHLAPGGRGWELLRDAKLREQIPALAAELDELCTLPFVDSDLGRYDVVADAWTTASVVDQTLGRATELDRALGYEANASGTSYLGPNPLALLGTLRVGSPQLTVTTERSMPGGVATVKWDDEGVVPEGTTLVKDGVLVDYQTTREQAPWLAPYYHKAGMPVRSHGYAGADSARHVTLQMPPNFTLTPATTDTSLADLIAGVKKGMLMLYGGASTDFQSKTGFARGAYHREIRDGKLGPLIAGGQALFSSVDLWNSLVALGGAGHAVTVDQSLPWQGKGQPGQSRSYSTRAVPALFKNVSMIR